MINPEYRVLVDKLASFYSKKPSPTEVQNMVEVVSRNWSVEEAKQILAESVKVRHVFPTIAALFEISRDLQFKTRTQKNLSPIYNRSDCDHCGNEGMLWAEYVDPKLSNYTAVVACTCPRGIYFRTLPNSGCPMNREEAELKGFRTKPMISLGSKDLAFPTTPTE